MVISERSVNLSLSDRDFAQYLVEHVRKADEAITLARDWFEDNRKSISEGVSIVSVALNKAKSINLPPHAEGADFNLDQKTFAEYIRNINNPKQRASTGLEWFFKNGVGYGDAPELATVVFNSL